MNNQDVVSWDEYLMRMAQHVSIKSKDNSTKVGAVVVNDRKSIITTGYNGLPRGVNENVPERHERPLKYYWYEHAERNAIYNSTTSLVGCIIYVNGLPPCVDCARAIIQAGIIGVVVNSLDVPDRWKETCDIALEMLKEANVFVRLPGQENEEHRQGKTKSQ